ncbi:hypothetical protein NB646_06520 [Oxalobacter aliiformigenes]|uniref:Uncharacterized protein n=1 Tax=Oxalobacter aliiformigenes TaxID=2946593 RepID=A0A9E9NSC7_9BURK|nr:hypothetical protein [Oxalobacter aliiformigenes]WAV90523.1 hypothetical protein NB646_06520 [Oxalobacter aliiformigenes]
MSKTKKYQSVKCLISLNASRPVMICEKNDSHMESNRQKKRPENRPDRY